MSVENFIKITCDKCGGVEDSREFDPRIWAKIKVEVVSGYVRRNEWVVCKECYPHGVLDREEKAPSFVDWIFSTIRMPLQLIKHKDHP